MAITSHKKHKIYLAATMDFGLGSNDPEENAFYTKIKAEINKAKKNRNIGIRRED